MELSVVVITYNRPFYLKRLLGGLSGQDDADKPNFKIVVIDDGSSKRNSALNKKAVDIFTSKLDIRYFYYQNKGVSASRNAGIRNSKGKYIAFIDDDAVPAKGWIQNIRKELETEDAVTGRVLPLKETMWGKLSAGDQGDSPKYLSFPLGRVSGCNMAFNRRVFEKAGYFDEYFTWGHDELEFSMRVLRYYKIKYCPDIIIYHNFCSGFLHLVKKYYLFGKKDIYFYRKTGIGGAQCFRDQISALRISLYNISFLNILRIITVLVRLAGIFMGRLSGS